MVVEKINFSIEEAAEASGLSKSKLYKLSAKGAFNEFAQKIGTRVLLPRGPFEDWLKSHTRAKSNRSK
jgi:excisionase family DNA binding protein